MENILTKEAKYAIATLYTAYVDRRDLGKSKSASIYFDNCTEDGRPILEDIKESIPELKKAGLIKCDVLGNVSLEDKAIIYMENLTKEKIKEWLSIISTITSIIH